MDVALKQVEKTVLAAIPAYETYFLQLMGKKFLFKPPLFKMTPELMRVRFDSVETGDGADKTPERLVMFVELNRAMGSCTVTTEYWQDISEPNPTARGEAKVDATSENLMAPAFAFGWLHKLVSDQMEALEGEDMTTPEARMQQAEKLILKADEVLEELGFAIEADSYESYANTLDNFLLTAGLTEQTEGILSKVGNVVRKAASAYGAAKGGAQGLKKRWGDFKASVKKSYDDSHKKAFDKFSGGAKKPEPKAAAPAAKGKLKLVKGGKGGKKMSDAEYRKRYGKARMASSLDTPKSNLAEVMSTLRAEYFEQEFNSLNVEELLALEELVVMMTKGELDESGEKFQIVFGKLDKAGVKDPKALARWVGTGKLGEAWFNVDGDPADDDEDDKKKKKKNDTRYDTGASISKSTRYDTNKSRYDTTKPWGGQAKKESAETKGAVSTYQKLAGLVMPMQSWSVPGDEE